MGRLTVKDVSEDLENLRWEVRSKRNEVEDENFKSLLSSLSSIANKVADSHRVEEAHLYAVEAMDRSKANERTIEFLLKKFQELMSAIKDLESRKQDAVPIVKGG